MTFSDLGLSEDVLRAVADAGYVEPTPIQRQAIPVVLMGRDVLGCAQTGTGKTASFTLPMIDILAAGRAKARMPRSLILEPTRELAAQVADAFAVYGKHNKLNKALLIGGESMADQMRVLDRSVDVLIATPGRLLDMFERGRLLLNDVKILVIDEADRMLDMGFIPDVEKIVSLVSRIRQTLFFSATMPPEIRRLADAFLSNPKEITVSPPSTPAATVTQGLCLVQPPRGGKPGSAAKEKRAVLRRLIESEDVRSALVFCNRKRDVGIVWRSLCRHGYSAGQLHGDMPQASRTETLAAFKRGEVRLLVCSDVAARGIDIQDMSHVFNFDVPSHAEDYVHRIGRTGRAGREGRAFTIALPEERKYLAAITRLIGREIPPCDLTTKKGKGAAAEEAMAAPVPSPTESGDAETEAADSRGRRRRGRSGGRQSEDKTETPRSNPAASKEKPADRSHRSRKGEADRDDDKPVRGLGDHVPAFLMRPVRPSTASSAEADEGNDDEKPVKAKTPAKSRSRSKAKPKAPAKARKPKAKAE